MCYVYMCAVASACLLHVCACLRVKKRRARVPEQEVGLQHSDARVMSLMSDPEHLQPRSPHLKAECLLASLMH